MEYVEQIKLHIETIRQYILQYDAFLGIPVPVIVTATFALLLVLLLKVVVLGLFLPRLQKSLKSRNLSVLHQITFEIKKPLNVFFTWSGLFAFGVIVTAPIADKPSVILEKLNAGFTKGFSVFTAFVFFWMFFRIIDPLYDLVKTHTSYFDSHDKSAFDFRRVLTSTFKILVGVIGFVTIFEQLGFNAVGVIASLSVVGAAGAFASKDTIANLFGSLVITLDDVVKKGDWVVYNGTTARVEEVGLRSTRIRGRDNAIRIIPNGLFANSEILNWMTCDNIRIDLSFKLKSLTEISTVEKIIERVKEMLRNQEDLTDFSMCFIQSIDGGQHSIGAFAFYKNGDYLNAMALRGKLLLECAKLVKAEGAELAVDETQIHTDFDLPKPEETPKKKISKRA